MQSCADFIGCDDPTEIVFGQNMTSLNFQLASALSRTWEPGDEVVVTRLDHDGNVSPWVQVANDKNATVRRVDFRTSDCLLLTLLDGSFLYYLTVPFANNWHMCDSPCLQSRSRRP